jgi:Rrf2 family protein
MAYSLSFSKAILVVIFVADKYRQGQMEYLSTAAISKVLNIPKPTVVKMLQSMAAEGIMETKEGKGGGIRLGRAPEQISVLDILESIERKPLFQDNFNIHAQGGRPDKAQVSIASLFAKAEGQMKQVLAQKSIADVLEEMGS